MGCQNTEVSLYKLKIYCKQCTHTVQNKHSIPRLALIHVVIGHVCVHTGVLYTGVSMYWWAYIQVWCTLVSSCTDEHTYRCGVHWCLHVLMGIHTGVVYTGVSMYWWAYIQVCCTLVSPCTDERIYRCPVHWCLHVLMGVHTGVLYTGVSMYWWAYIQVCCTLVSPCTDGCTYRCAVYWCLHVLMSVHTGVLYTGVSMYWWAYIQVCCTLVSPCTDVHANVCMCHTHKWVHWTRKSGFLLRLPLITESNKTDRSDEQWLPSQMVSVRMRSLIVSTTLKVTKSHFLQQTVINFKLKRWQLSWQREEGMKNLF
jgi:hypothetical protein